MDAINVKYESRAELRGALAAYCLKQRIRTASDSEWQEVDPEHPPIYGEADVNEVYNDLSSFREDERLRRLRAKGGRLRLGQLYDEDEERVAVETSHERAKVDYVVRSVKEFRTEAWGEPEPPFPTDEEMASWMRRPSLLTEPIFTGIRVEIPSSGPFSFFGDTRYVEPDSVLGSLKLLADRLSRELGCFPSQAMRLVLTGEIPIVMPVTAELGKGGIGLQVNYLWVDSKTVRRVYQAVKELLPALAWGSGGRGEKVMKGVSLKISQLLRFDDEVSLPWLKKWQLWNERYPAWPYGTPESMASSLSNANRRFKTRGVKPPGVTRMMKLAEWERRGYVRVHPTPVKLPSPADVLAFDTSKPRLR